MRVFIIDTSNMGPELQGGLIGVIGSSDPSAEEKQECVDTVSRYAMDGWAISADPFTPIGWLAALTAEAGCVPCVSADELAEMGTRDDSIALRGALEEDATSSAPSHAGPASIPDIGNWVIRTLPSSSS